MNVVDARMSPQSLEMVRTLLPQTQHYVIAISTLVSSHLLKDYLTLIICIQVKGSQNCSTDGVQEYIYAPVTTYAAN
jgi:hypothetical protein